MLSRRRLVLTLGLLLFLAAGLWTAWLALQVRDDLALARSAAERLQTSVREADRQARLAATADLQGATADAVDRTEGAWWGALTALPLVGDDAEGVRALAGSLDTVATDAMEPLGRTVDRLGQVSGDGGVDLAVVEDLQHPVDRARDALTAAHERVAALDSEGYAGSLRRPFEEYVAVVDDARRALGSSATALEVLPAMLGGEQPRRYLMVFQNNAEIRATGGLPGSWAVVEADGGELRITRQGTGGQFGELDEPLPLSKAERTLYGAVHGSYFLDANFTPDFPRAAELWNARWELDYPRLPLDGVVSLDPVTLSYLVEGTGPIQAAGTTLTPDNLVEELLSRPYRELDPLAQDALFAGVARAIFDAVSGDLASPVDFVQGLDRAVQEGRFRVASFTDAEAEALAGTRVLGALSGDDGRTPHVDIGLNDATGSKMSYYLRYYGSVASRGCRDGVQQLAGTMRLRQSISPQEARRLPESVTGTGQFGTDPGSQLVLVRVHAPYGGSFGEMTIDGRRIDRDVRVVELDGRPVATFVVLLGAAREVVLNWTMEAGPGQTADGELEMTPSVVPGRNRWTFASSC